MLKLYNIVFEIDSRYVQSYVLKTSLIDKLIVINYKLSMK